MLYLNNLSRISRRVCLYNRSSCLFCINVVSFR